MAVSMVGALLLSAAAAQEALSEIEVGELGATDLLGRKADLGVDTNSFEYTQVPDLGGRTWDGYRDPLNEKLIEICEEKDPSLPQENMLKAVIADGASPSYQGEYKRAPRRLAPPACPHSSARWPAMDRRERVRVLGSSQLHGAHVDGRARQDRACAYPPRRRRRHGDHQRVGVRPIPHPAPYRLCLHRRRRDRRVSHAPPAMNGLLSHLETSRVLCRPCRVLCRPCRVCAGRVLSRPCAVVRATQAQCDVHRGVGGAHRDRARDDRGRRQRVCARQPRLVELAAQGRRDEQRRNGTLDWTGLD
jgi:hypothetical protein